MTVWIDPSEEAKYGVCIGNYNEGEGENKAHRLKLFIGDAVHILKQNADWFYGHTIRDRSVKGIFPKSYIHLKDAIIRKSGSYETVVANEIPIVQEITSVLREWGKLWKQLYIRSASGEPTIVSNFSEVHNMMIELIRARKLIMAHTITVDELKELQQKVTNMIDMGNARLDLDLVVRDEGGNILSPKTTSTIKLYRQHVLATQRIQEEREGIHGHKQGKGAEFNLLVDIKNFVCKIGEKSEVYTSLYDAKTGNYISESYISKWGEKGVPQNLDMLSNLRVLFTDLGIKDTQRERVFLVNQIVRVGKMDIKEVDLKRDTTSLRRPFGVAVLDLTEILNGTLAIEGEKEVFIPFQQIGEKENLDSLIKKVVSAKEVNHKGQGLWVTLRKLHGEFKQIQKEYPHLVGHPTAVARKMGFTDAIMPDDVRNDLYVTLTQGEFKKAGKSSDKNVEVTMCVCNRQGEVLENVICEGAGGEMLTQYKSVVYYHEDKPKWFETVKICIPIKNFDTSHLRFTFKHRSSLDAKDRTEKPFAVSYIELMRKDGTVLSDGAHDMLLYKFDWKKGELKASGYLDVPSMTNQLETRSGPGGTPLKPQGITKGPLTLNMNDAFQIALLVCSTKLTQNVDLMGLLKWRDNPDQLKSILQRFRKVDGDEVVKFIHDILDSLFNIFMQESDQDYDDLVFDALIFLVGLVSDRKYQQFRPVLDMYINENFSATLAYNKLMAVLKSYIERVHQESKHESLMKAMKSLEYIFKFIIRSRVLLAALNQNKGREHFEAMLRQVYEGMTAMMTDPAQNLVGVQGSCLKYLPTTVPDVITVFDPQELSKLLVKFLDSGCHGDAGEERLSRQRLACENALVHGPLFLHADSRRVLLPVILAHVRRHLEQHMAELSGSRRTSNSSNRIHVNSSSLKSSNHRSVVSMISTAGATVGEDEIDVCIKILSDVMHLLKRDDVGPTASDLSTITHTILRTVTQTVIAMHRENPLIGNCVAVMTSILRQMSIYHYKEYIAHFETPIDLSDFLLEILMVFRDLVTRNPYPQDWCEMIMVQNSVFLQALQIFSNTIRDRFSEPFYNQLWKTYFLCAISYLTQDALQLESFSVNKRNKIIATYKDPRREAGFEIRAMWSNLGQHKIQFIPEMVGPILQMTLIPETELRKATIPIFYDMMQCEFRHSNCQHFQKFEEEMITKLDELVGEEGKGDQQYMHLFHTILRDMCGGHSTMRETGLRFVEIVRKLLKRLLEYRDVVHDENQENSMNCTVNLLNFYHEIQRKDMYVKYVHRLCDLHLQCDNFTEAAYTMMLYAKLLKWSDEDIPEMLRSDRYPDCHTHRELKEKVYYDIIKYFDNGKMWEKGIELCKELAQQYESETFDYTQLAKLLTKQAHFYDGILKTMRPEPEYFRVGYYGLGFPPFLQNKVYIYRGKEYERLSDFAGGLQNQFPNAQMMRTLNEPGDDILNATTQYLQINAVTPKMELKAHLKNKRVHEQILKFYKVNEVRKFTFSRKKAETSDMTQMYLARTNLETKDSLPGILRWFPVISTSQVEVSPLENAIETFEATNIKIKALIDQHRNDPSLRVDPLGMLLNGVVDAAVNGGISNYQEFYTEKYLTENPEGNVHRLVKRLKQVTTLQLMLLQTGLEIHRDNAPDNLLPFQAHMDQRYNEMKVHIEQNYGIHLTEEIRMTLAKQHLLPVKRSKTMQVRRAQEYSTLQKPKRQGSPSPTKAVMQAAAINRSASAVTPGSSSMSSSSSSSSPSKFYVRLGNKSPRGSLISSSGDVREGSQSPRNSKTLGTPGSSSKDRDSAVIVLKEELTPQRPPRPDSRPNSAHLKHYRSMLSTTSTTSSSSDNHSIRSSNTSTSTLRGVEGEEEEDEDEGTDKEDEPAPPPLPSKQIPLVDESLIGNGGGGGGGVSRGSAPAGDYDEMPPVLPTKAVTRRSTGRLEAPLSLPPGNGGNIPLSPSPSGGIPSIPSKKSKPPTGNAESEV